nr:hypothetical protein [Tanacetum cinerariifolium]
MHKKAHQAAGGPISLGDTGKKETTLSSVVIPQLKLILEYLLLRIPYHKNRVRMKEPKAIHLITYLQGANKESKADDISLIVKLEDLSDILKDTRSTFFNADSLPDEPIIVSDESKAEEEVAKDKDTEATSHDVHLLQSHKEELEQAKVKAAAKVASMKAKPLFPNIKHLFDLLVTSLKPKISRLLASHNFTTCLPTELKELPLKITRLSREIKELMKSVRDMEIKLPGDLEEIPTKLKTFTSTISSLSSQFKEKIKALDSLPSQATASPAKGEKYTKNVDTNLKDELVDLLGKNVVTQYYTKKLLFDKYRDKMLKRKKSPKITNCKVLKKKGPITLKIYKEDGLMKSTKISNSVIYIQQNVEK